MKKWLLLSLIFFTGCIHRPDIEQGNILTETELQKLHKGMTETEVKALLGNPVLSVPFNQKRMEYVYTFQKGGQRGHGKRLTLSFKDQKLVRIQQEKSFLLPE